MKCLGSALLPPGSRCSHRDKDERQHSAADWTSCSKPRLCELAGDWGRPRDSLLSAAFMKLPSAARPGPLRMWSTAEPWLSPVRCFSKEERWGRGHRRFRNGISGHPAKGWAEGLRGLKLVPRQSLSPQLWEHMCVFLDSSSSHGDRDRDSLGSSNRASPADVYLWQHIVVREMNASWKPTTVAF